MAVFVSDLTKKDTVIVEIVMIILYCDRIMYHPF